MLDMPYFMTDKTWYEYDFDNHKFILTSNAPEEAVESYQEYMEALNKDHIKDG